MTSSTEVLTAAEKRFRLWMWFSFWMYTLGIPLFLVLGRQTAAFLNGLPSSLLQLPPWETAGSGMEIYFWQVLGISLMGILGILCLFIALDVRRYGPVINALLCAKLISTVCYTFLFLGSGNLAYLVAVLTDGSIFALSWVLWFMASPATEYLNAWEKRILVTAGETLLPKDGAFPTGYADVQERCLADAQRFLAAQSPLDIAGTRLLLRALDIMPLFLLKFRLFHKMVLAERVALFERLEQSTFGPLRLMMIAVKLYVVMPFFNPQELEAGIQVKETE
jgi:hypothetical protein